MSEKRECSCRALQMPLSSDADWFENVENLRPLREGRRAGTLNEVSRAERHRISIQEAEQRFQDELERSRVEERSDGDALKIMWEYVCWFEENFPSGRRDIFYPILYKICTTFCVEPAFINDERMLKLWLKLADAFPESGLAVMEFAFTRGSCRQLAKFYIRWSESYQSMGWWNRAREKLELGIKMCAMPLPLLHEARNELEAQAMRALKSSSLSDDDDETDGDVTLVAENRSSEHNGGQRRTLGSLRALGKKHMAPIFRYPQGPPGRVPNSAYKLKPQQNSFEVFVESGGEQLQFDPRADTTAGAVYHSGIAKEFENDPDYQALFGFFDVREKAHLQLTNAENLSKESVKMGDCKLCPQSETSVDEDAPFEVYADVGTLPSTSNRARKDQLKEPAKLSIRKSLLHSSMEEAYAHRMAALSV